LWIPVPREWDSQKAVKIISVNPPPHAEYKDPEYGNRMLFWDFGKEPEKTSYRVDIKFRLESYETYAEVDPEHIGQYDKSSMQYVLYTRSSHTLAITPRIREIAQEAVGDEKNPYLQAERIFKFVRKKVRYKMLRPERGVGTEVLLNFPLKSKETGEEYYQGACDQYSNLFIALCRAVGIPARAVVGFGGWNPWIKEKDLKLNLPIELNLSPGGLSGTQYYTAMMPHVWAEFYLAGYGWIPVEVTGGDFGHTVHARKARDMVSSGYFSTMVQLTNCRQESGTSPRSAKQRLFCSIIQTHSPRTDSPAMVKALSQKRI
jgi:transglutaminase-like putative cysteine protease